MSAFRPLPSNPSLAYERKEAKALLRQLKAGDRNALARARARHPAMDESSPGRIQLADAQLVIAREYGFSSWPRLVHYFEALERQRLNARQVHHGPDFYESYVRWLLAEHRRRRPSAGRSLAAYVPRFYGMRLDDVFATTVTEEEARLAVARQFGLPSWDALIARVSGPRPWDKAVGNVDLVMREAGDAMKAGDLEQLKRVVAENPELLHPSDDDVATGRLLIRSALHHERRLGQDPMRPIIEWLEAQGLDVQLELNRWLCGRLNMPTADVRWLLERGADPNWVALNGIPVLEHALIRYWNGEAVDVLAAHVRPRKALWIAAGLGDVQGVRRSLDTGGKPTRAARRLRPDFDAAGQFGMLSQHPDPDDEEILMEAFVVAMLNGRTAVLEYMASRGFPLNSLIYESPVINLAVGNEWVPVVECLVKCGADLDLKGRQPDMSAREIARELFEQSPEIPERRRIIELLGMDPDATLAERDARRPAT